MASVEVAAVHACSFKPERTLLFGFGHDEEVGGEKGAGSIARLLASRGVRLEMVNDEGGMLSVDGLKPLTSTPVALIGTAEKVHAGQPRPSCLQICALDKGSLIRRCLTVS